MSVAPTIRAPVGSSRYVTATLVGRFARHALVADREWRVFAAFRRSFYCRSARGAVILAGPATLGAGRRVAIGRLLSRRRAVGAGRHMRPRLAVAAKVGALLWNLRLRLRPRLLWLWLIVRIVLIGGRSLSRTRFAARSPLHLTGRGRLLVVAQEEVAEPAER
jgi:hypothetical protein